MIRIRSSSVFFPCHLALVATLSLAARGTEVSLPADVVYDESVPHPREILGFELGEWHVRHDQLLTYFEQLAGASQRIEIEHIGATHEGRALINALISTPSNLAKLGTCENRSNSATSGRPSAECPLVVQLGYSIHGNEASGSNASLLMAYHLVAATDETTRDWLERAVVIIDPSLNPDGLARFAQWANMHRGQVAIGDEFHREHREHWPSGRTNHYWFDLNRDWLLATQPESRARLAAFHRFRPHVLADFHEMGSNRTYFFQPGVATRQNPRTPARNLELTSKLAAFHGEALDSIGSLFYSGESFDDFYYGKGSTYPDVNGSVGILFEQASARGRAMKTANGLLTFSQAIVNQLTTSMSTLRGAIAMEKELHTYRDWFDQSALEEAAEDSVRGYVFGDRHDFERTGKMVRLLLAHRIEVQPLTAEFVSDKETFSPGTSFWVTTQQPQYRLVKSLFEPQREFADSTFYDVSTWTIPFSFGIPYQARTKQLLTVGPILDSEPRVEGVFRRKESAVAYSFPWSPYDAPRALGLLHAADVKARVATRPRSIERNGTPAPFGDIVIPVGIQSLDRAALEQLLEVIATENTIEIGAVESGLNQHGPDLGSPNLRPLEKPRPALLVGGHSSTYQAGQIWHLLDHRFNIPTTLLDWRDLGKSDLERYSHLIVVGGKYSMNEEIDESLRSRLEAWLDTGGTWIGIKEGARLVDRLVAPPDDECGAAKEQPRDTESDEQSRESEEESEKPDEVKRLPYGEYRDRHEANQLNGSIFATELDLTHPLAFGYQRIELPVFRTDRDLLETPADPYATVGVYSKKPLLSGYSSPENVERLAGSAALTATRHGQGVIIRFADDPTFRAVWYGTEKLFLNAVFFSTIIDKTGDTSAPP